jgi:hypothetical protein
LLGWLLPHGVIEIPAIVLAGQAGLVLAGALIGWGKTISLKERLRNISGDLVTLIMGVAVMLIWAGIVEAFFSQYHEPVIAYEVKIGFGILEFILLILFLAKSGRRGRGKGVEAKLHRRPRQTYTDAKDLNAQSKSERVQGRRLKGRSSRLKAES